MRLSKQEREQVYNLFGGRCAYCGCQLDERWHADHFLPVVRGIASKKPLLPKNDNIENIFPSCPPCNIDKHSFDIEFWRAKLQSAVHVLQRNSPTFNHAVRYGLVSITGTPIVFYFEKFNQQKGGKP